MTFPRTLATVGAVLALGVLAGCSDDEPSGTPDPTPSSTTSAPTSAPTSDATSESPVGDLNVTPFFVGDAPRGQALFREVHTGVTADDAVALLLSGPADPDYRTLLPSGSLEPGAGFDGVGADGTHGIELTDASWTERPSEMSAAEARLAVQQLVWTVNSLHGGALDLSHHTGAEVRFYLDGEEVSYLGVPSGVEAEPELDVLAMVNVTDPAEGATVADTFTATGMASSFEATVPWEVQDGTGKVVLEGFATAEGWIERLYPWSAEVDVSELPAGDYTFVARTDDPSDGEGGGPTQDTKRITVQ
ncbi:Gmad2 immunoglobulin-like domain-containing protein [Nocardioides albidus]|nr:Gmad2 immunoglobulin-like domain-containing protein [Nocardioides albidus]